MECTTRDSKMADVNYDVFENSSPKRPITAQGEPAHTDTVDEVLHNHTVVNFSRKRGVQDGRNSYDQASEHGSKRQRHAQWPAQPIDQDEVADNRDDAAVMSPGRLSKFQEASMSDRPSEKPPSMFTRHLNKHVDLSMDELMSQYHTDNDKPLPPYPSSRTLPRFSRSPERKATFAPHSASTFSLDTQDEDAKGSGIFRFGRSMASAFNPLNVWSRFTTGWRAAKEELVEEAEDAKKKDMLDRQKAQAAELYAQMKQSGNLEGLGAHASSTEPAFGADHAKRVRGESQRDSGISIDTAPRASVDTSKSSFLSQDPAAGKSRRHSRTSSFHDLKRAASSISLHRRSASTSRSPEKEDMDTADDSSSHLPRSKSRGNILEGALGSIRGIKSRNSLTEDVDEFGTVRSRKQVKLTKRVSNLEAKLEAARKELDRALVKPAPPIPSMPPTSPRRPLPRPDTSRAFVPALPTLLSESLLLPHPTMLDSAVVDEPMHNVDMDGVAADKLSVADDMSAKDEALQESNGNGFYLRQNDTLLKGDITNSPPSKENVPSTPEPQQQPPSNTISTPSQEQTFLADASSPRTGSAKKRGQSSGKKKRSSDVDRTYRPGSESNVDDEAEWKAEKPKKAKHKSDEGITEKETAKRLRTSRLPTATTDASKSIDKKTSKSKVLRKPVPSALFDEPQMQKHLPPTPMDLDASTRNSFDTLQEETVSFTNVIPAKKGSPRKPTAKATPATFQAYRSPTQAPSSPLYGSPKRARRALTPKRTKGRDARSSSPPPSSARLKFAAAEADKVMVAQPNGGDVPPLPKAQSRGLENKSSFEWPEDVF